MADSNISIPIESSLVEDSQALAKELNISWSRLITVAIGEFVRRHRKRQDLIDRINAAYADAPDEDERRTQEGMKATQRRLLEGEW
ncbi:MAG: hypothetical protein AAF716_04785 [Cyanobacteria bacterium P01_D01_bin.1]